MTDFYIHAFCLDGDKYTETGEIVLGPYTAVGLTWDGIYGYRHEGDGFQPPDNVMFWANDQGGWNLAHRDPTAPRFGFYSDIEFITSAELKTDDWLAQLPRYAHAKYV